MTTPSTTPILSLSAAFAGPGQRDRLLRLHTRLGPDVLVAETLDGWESVDHGGFRFQLTALSTDAHLDLQALPGTPVLLELLTADSRTEPRPFHGHIGAIERLASNGGLTRYRLVIEPWLACLRLTCDSRIFHDLSVPAIVDELLGAWRGQGALAPAWRWELADPEAYLQRSRCTQYEESDYAFLHRLLTEEGLFYWFEHAGDPGSDGLGTHTLVIADHADAFGPRPGVPVRFHRGDATEASDSLQAWSEQRAETVNHVVLQSWDYRQHRQRRAEAMSLAEGEPPRPWEDTLHPYAWPTDEVGQRYADRSLEAFQAAALTYAGQGRWRRMAAGQRFALQQHPRHRDENDSSFVCLRVQHRARNNLRAEFRAEVEARLGLPEPAPALPAALAGLQHHAPGAALPATDFYDNRFLAQPSQRPYRPPLLDPDGHRRWPRPLLRGVQPALVIGPGGAPLHTDRDHRVLVQFPWQRGSAASSRQPHPRGDNAPGQAGSGSTQAWVRVQTPVAGADWGGVWIPRLGQEVLVAFLEGDPDRPVVVGAVHNGRGHEDAPHNRIAGGPAGATGNAPAWFAGNGHPAVLSGFKSQALASSQSGTGDHGQLVFDDTPGQGRIALETTRTDAGLSLGHHKHQQDNVRGADLGYGLHLHTQAQGALRSGAGLLLSTAPGAQQLSSELARERLSQGQALIDALAGAAAEQDAALPDEADTLPVSAAAEQLADALQTREDGREPAPGIGGGHGSVPAWSDPLLVAESAAGLSSLTPASQVWVAGTHAGLSAQQDINLTGQGDTVLAVANGAALFTQGQAGNPDKPTTETGIALHAASGPMRAVAAASTATLASRQAMTLASHQADTTLQAATHLLLTAAGAFLRIEGDSITVGAPGKVEFKASQRELAGPKGGDLPKPGLPGGDYKGCASRMQDASEGGAALV